MDGSSLATSALEVNLRVNWPEIGNGCSEDNVISMLGCWAGSTVSETPVIVGVGTVVDPIESWNCLVAIPEALSATLTVNVGFSTVVGVPLMTPVEGFRLSPAGSVPALMDQE
jgi:hypothetical protein